MNIGVLGTGMVGRAIAARLVELGHAVQMGTRDPQETLARAEADGMGGTPFSEWHRQNPAVGVVRFAGAAAFGEMIVNATHAAAALEILAMAGESNLNGKVLIDLTNPLYFSKGMPPTLFVSNTDSLGEQIQRAYPGVQVVKTLNTLTAVLMVYPERIGGGEHSVFVSGNDAAAKARVTDLLRSFGWRDIIDLGDITTARGVEMYLPLWLRMWNALGTGVINVKVVR
jgi:predicted dinucleotide-binding enzyme